VETIAKLANAFILLVFGLLNVAVIVMRASGIAAYDPSFRTPAYPATQLIGVAGTFALMVEIGWLSILFTAGMVGACLLWWRWWARHCAVRQGAVYHWFERLGQRRDDRLDAELVGIVQEEGLRDEDRFDEVVGRALVVDRSESVSVEGALQLACRRLAGAIDLDAEALLERAAAHRQTIGGHAMLASALMEGPARPELVMVRRQAGASAAPDEATTPRSRCSSSSAVATARARCCARWPRSRRGTRRSSKRCSCAMSASSRCGCGRAPPPSTSPAGRCASSSFPLGRWWR
jgi:hypothetical protein